MAEIYQIIRKASAGVVQITDFGFIVEERDIFSIIRDINIYEDKNEDIYVTVSRYGGDKYILTVEYLDDFNHNKYTDKVSRISSDVDTLFKYIKELGKIDKHYMIIKWIRYNSVTLFFRLLNPNYSVEETRLKLDDIIVSSFIEFETVRSVRVIFLAKHTYDVVIQIIVLDD